tara:strand:+ start:596 stop:1246 length:651 start_codon:yes stop_codon:yes gene_type:complete
MNGEMMPKINIHLGCSLEAMREMEDNQYTIAIVDPPYGLDKKSWQGGGLKGEGQYGNRAFFAHYGKATGWDKAPSTEYFEQLMRVSQNQIIWGGNYFDLPPSRCIIAWDKVQPWTNFSQWEMAWTSFDKPAPLFKFDNRYSGKIHPTQKPIELYRWLLDKFVQPGETVLDTHLGSGSIACACYDAGISLDAWEIDAEYHKKTVERFNEYSRQIKLF